MRCAWHAFGLADCGAAWEEPGGAAAPGEARGERGGAWGQRACRSREDPSKARARALRLETRQKAASMAFVTDSNRPQPLWQPPPTACPTASGAASEIPSKAYRSSAPPNWSPGTGWGTAPRRRAESASTESLDAIEWNAATAPRPHGRSALGTPPPPMASGALRSRAGTHEGGPGDENCVLRTSAVP